MRLVGVILRKLPIIRNHHRFYHPTSWAIEATRLIEKSLATRAIVDKSLIWRLRLSGINISGIPKETFSNILYLLGGRNFNENQLQSLETWLSDVPSNILPCQQWLRLTELFCFNGRYPLAQICREHARQLAILPFKKRNARPPISWNNSIAAALEGGECNDHDALDQILQKAKIEGSEVAKWHLLLSVLNGEHVPESDIDGFDKTGYFEFVKNKNIVIVGAAPTEAQDAVAIDMSDVVIRFNHRVSGKGTDSIHKGLRTDVTCFNGEHSSALIVEKKGILPSEITWACFKQVGVNLEVQAKNANKHCRTLLKFDAMNFHGTCNMVPIVALDLGVFTTRPVKIYHTDLMLTVLRSKDYYPQSFKRDSIHKMRSIFLSDSIHHDPVLQYRKLHRLWKNKKIQGDERFEQVMSMGLDFYLRKLERLYASYNSFEV